MKVVLPAPFAPTMAIFSPGRMLTEMFFSVGESFLAYWKVTFRNSMPCAKGRGTGRASGDSCTRGSIARKSCSLPRKSACS